MFDGMKKRRLESAILTVSKNLIYVYKQGIMANKEQLETAGEDGYDAIYSQVMKQYYDAVNNTILEGMDSNTKVRVRLAMDPILSPVKDLVRDNGVYMGGTFAGILWWALEDKELDSYTMSKIDHLQMDIVQNALVELSIEMG